MSFIEIHTMISIHHKLNFNHLFSLFGVSIHIIYKISIVMTMKHIYYGLFISIIKWSNKPNTNGKQIQIFFLCTERLNLRYYVTKV